MNSFLAGITINLAERGILPDSAIRAGIRSLLKQRLRGMEAEVAGDPGRYLEAFVADLARRSIAESTADANEQHYELPADFFQRVLGPRLKYSACLYPQAATTLAEAEECMLAVTCERAGLKDGMDILEIGCGWGSLSLYMAEKFPRSRITAISNSRSQGSFINDRAAEKGWSHLRAETHDINSFQPGCQFDRIVSVEMFEHVRNYARLFARVASWLKPDGRLFVHVFAHRSVPYLFETEGADNWMGRYFFTGGTMPSHDLFTRAQTAMDRESDWWVNGIHYSKTLEDWLIKMDSDRAGLLSVLSKVYGEAQAVLWFQRWRIFMMACSELFRYAGGDEWGVSHQLFKVHV